MAAPYLGGLKIDAAQWVSTHAIRVRFTSSWGSACLYQLYAGRIRIGSTANPAERSIVGQLKPTAWPQFLQLVAVDPVERLTDYGPDLPLRPYNRVRITAAITDPDEDAAFVEVAAGTTVGGAVDEENILEKVPFKAEGNYSILTPPLEGSGEWNFEIATRDNRPLTGNRSAALALSATVLATPPDVRLSGGRRLSVSLAAGVATINWVNP